MMGRLLVLFAVCALAAAMVPRDRRAVESEEQTTIATVLTAGPVLCAPSTPCAWTVYKNEKENVEYNLTNTYCTCGEGTVCRVYLHDSQASVFIHRCLLPEDSTDEATEVLES